jgi:lipopolysaccharide transport system permease protein
MSQLDVSTLGGSTTVGPGKLRIEPRKGWRLKELAEVWQYRDLLWYLALRDVRVRYKQTALGASWAILQPLITMVVLNLFFGQVLGVAKRVGDVPYPVFLYAGLLPWQFFATAVNLSSSSLVSNAGLLRKVYFPRLVAPLAALGVPLVDYLAAAGVLGALMLFFGVSFQWQLLLLPLALASTVVAALGVGLLLSALTVSYRDFRHVVPFLVQTWFFVTPVIYPSRLAEHPLLQSLLQLNPMGGTIEAARAAVLGTPIDYVGWLISLEVATVMLIAGLAYFNRVERRFADIV